jgi:hypothetical protein
MKLQARQLGITLTHGVQINRIYIQPDNAFRKLAINPVQPVSAGDAKDRD